MIGFLTSNPFLDEGEGLNPANGFVDELRASLPEGPLNAVFVASSPDRPEVNDFYAAEQRACFEASGFRFRSFRVLDRRTAGRASDWIGQAGLIILTGGHVPTQNAFFAEIGLKALLRGFDGVLIGISAGTMNAATTVYAQPELPGEAVDPGYRRFLPGLGLTEAMVLPHFDGNLFATLDGLGIYRDITLPDSLGRRFHLLPDGSYIHIRGNAQVLRGEAWLAEDGALRLFCREGDGLPCKPM